MAFQIAFEDVSGISHPACYARVELFLVDIRSRTCSIDLVLYHDATTYKAGKRNVATITVVIPPAQFVKYTSGVVGENVIQLAYRAARDLEPRFTGALDV